MNRSFIGLVAGLAIGLVGGALIAKTRPKEPKLPAPSAPAPVPAPLPPPPPPPPPVVEDSEVPALKARIADLEAQLAAKATTAPPPTTADPSKPEWRQKLDSLLKKGIQGYKSDEFRKAVAELLEHKKEGLEALAEKLLKSESAGERFLAAALMEDMDDPEAISALAQALQKDDDLLVRRMSSHAIAMIQNEAGLPSLRTAMSSDTDWGVRVNSAYGVAKLGQPDGVKMLEDSYRSTATPAEYKFAVLGGLADVASPSSAPIFKKILGESTEFTALYMTIGAVEKMKDVSFLPDLNRIAADSKYPANVREHAKKVAEALAK